MVLLRNAVAFVCLSAGLAACGLKGPLEPPPGPHVYTTPDDPKSRKDDVRKGDDFILDPLIE